jgi:hypothetical protein
VKVKSRYVLPSVFLPSPDQASTSPGLAIIGLGRRLATCCAKHSCPFSAALSISKERPLTTLWVFGRQDLMTDPHPNHLALTPKPTVRQIRATPYFYCCRPPITDKNKDMTPFGPPKGRRTQQSDSWPAPSCFSTVFKRPDGCPRMLSSRLKRS